MAEQIISQEYLKSIFDYKDGHLYWKIKKSSTAMPNQQAGYISGANNVDIVINYKTYKAHRLIYLMHYGCLPIEVDHIDGNPLNNNIENLRPATHAENIRNSKLRKDNKSGEKGVLWDKRSNKWRTHCVFEGKQYSAGSYKNINEAIENVRKLREKLHKQFAKHK